MRLFFRSIFLLALLCFLSINSYGAKPNCNSALNNKEGASGKLNGTSTRSGAINYVMQLFGSSIRQKFDIDPVNFFKTFSDNVLKKYSVDRLKLISAENEFDYNNMRDWERKELLQEIVYDKLKNNSIHKMFSRILRTKSGKIKQIQSPFMWQVKDQQGKTVGTLFGTLHEYIGTGDLQTQFPKSVLDSLENSTAFVRETQSVGELNETAYGEGGSSVHKSTQNLYHRMAIQLQKLLEPPNSQSFYGALSLPTLSKFYRDFIDFCKKHPAFYELARRHPQIGGEPHWDTIGATKYLNIGRLSVTAVSLFLDEVMGGASGYGAFNLPSNSTMGEHTDFMDIKMYNYFVKKTLQIRKDLDWEDDFYFGVAARKGPAYTLEDAEFQLSMLRKIYDKKYLTKEILAEGNFFENQLKTMLNEVNSYIDGDLNTFDGIVNNFSAKERDLFFDQRNKKWVEQLIQIFEKEENTFVAVGVYHLSGPSNLRDLLTKEGYTLERVP